MKVHARRDMLAEKRGRVISLLPRGGESDVSFYGYAETDGMLALDGRARKMERLKLKLKKKQEMEKKAKSKRKDKRSRAGESEDEEKDDDLDDDDGSARPRKKIERGWYGSI